MNLIDQLFKQRRMIFTVTVLFVLMGIGSFLTMARQEDPSFPYRAGLLTVAFPGAEPEQVERLVLKPLEEELAEVEEIDFVKSVARTNVAILTVMLQDHVYDTDPAWDRVRQAMARAEKEFPDGVETPTLEDREMDNPSVVLSITGDVSTQVLADTAKDLKDYLLGMREISRIEIEGDPEQQITIALKDSVAARLGISPHYVAKQLDERNQIIPGGSIKLSGKSLNLLPTTEFESLDQIRSSQIQLPSGQFVPLASIAKIDLGAQEPPQPRVWQDGERAVLVNIINVRGQTDAIAFGVKVREKIATFQAIAEPVQITEMFFQPDQVAKRLDNLQQSLLVSIIIICGVVFYVMGFRMGLLVAMVLPIVALISLALYDLGGGVLHQIAVIGVVISLGILVDNAIVMVENMQWRLNQGDDASISMRDAIKELGTPLGAATGTTVAAFLPLLLSSGNAADFTRGIPIMIILTLTVSYFVAVLFTPLMARYVLKPESVSDSQFMERLGKWLAQKSVARPGRVMGFGVLVVASSVMLSPWLSFQFFPQADRNQVVVNLTMPEGTHIDTTTIIADRVERELRKQADVLQVHRYVGFSGPKFYYNLSKNPNAPHKARLAVITTGQAGNQRIINTIRDFANEEFPELTLVANILGQGPPQPAPVEIRVFNNDPAKMAEATNIVFRQLKQIPGAVDIRHDLSLGVPGLAFEIHDVAAMKFGVDRARIAESLFGRSYGLPIEQYRQDDDPIPMVVRSEEGQDFPLEKLRSLEIHTNTGELVPISQVANLKLRWQPGAINHRNQERVVLVLSELESGVPYSKVLDQFSAAMKDVSLPEGTRLQFGGDKEGSGDANLAVLKSAPIGILILLFFLMLQFNSFTRVGIILLTVPFAAAGILPGLVFSGSPFGFQSTLGVISLVGIVVNNAIVLIDRIDSNMAEGFSIKVAVHDAVVRRTQPILLTTATTIAGLLPLAFSSSTLWPPMAWAIISGLAASTILSLLVIPAACVLLLKSKNDLNVVDEQPEVKSMKINATAMQWGAIALLMFGFSTISENVEARQLTLEETITKSYQRAQLKAAQAELQSSKYEMKAVRAEAYFPVVNVQGKAKQQGEASSFDTPIGSFPVSGRDQTELTVELRQPLFNWSTMVNRTRSAEASVKSFENDLTWQHLLTANEAINSHLDILALQAERRSTQKLMASLLALEERTKNLSKAGRVLRADLLDVTSAVHRARQQLITLNNRLFTAQRIYRVAIAEYEGDWQPAPLGGLAKQVSIEPVVQLSTTAFSVRPDIKALERKLESVKQAAKAQRNGYLPQVDMVARHFESDGQAFFPNGDYQVAVEVNWQPFDSFRRSHQSSATLQKREVLRFQLDELKQGVTIEIQSAVSNFHTAKGLRNLAEQTLISAQASLQSRRARYDAGRINIDEMLEAETSVANEQALLETSDIDIVRAWSNVQLVSGRAVQLPASQ